MVLMLVLTHLNQAKVYLALILTACFLLAGASLLATPPPLAADNPSYSGRQALIIFMVCLNFGKAFLFYYGLAGFKTAFRRSYHLVCLGSLLLGPGSLVYLIALQFGAEETSYTVLIAEMILAIASAVMFTGFVRFARLLQVRTWLASTLWLLVFSVFAAAVVWLLPHRERLEVPEFIFDVSHTLFFIEILFSFLAASLVLKIRSVASKAYSQSLLLFGIGSFALGVAAAGLVSFDYIPYPDWVKIDYLIAPYLVGGILSLTSAYTFNKIGAMQQALRPNDDALLDSVTFLLSLASKPTDVEPIIEQLRVVTSTMSRTDSGTISTDNKRALLGIYYQIEEYLVTKERLRALTKETLRQLIQERSGLVITDPPQPQ